jgi:hypothetical protein
MRLGITFYRYGYQSGSASFGSAKSLMVKLRYASEGPGAVALIGRISSENQR